MRRRKKVQIFYIGYWKVPTKRLIFECCHCGIKEHAELKIDKRGRIWMRVTEIVKPAKKKGQR